MKEREKAEAGYLYSPYEQTLLKSVSNVMICVLNITH